MFFAKPCLVALNCIRTTIITTELARQFYKLSFVVCFLKMHPLLREIFAERCITHSVHRWIAAYLSKRKATTIGSCFTIYDYGAHLSHVTWTICTNFCSPFPRRVYMIFGFYWPSNFRGENCEQTTDGPWCMIHYKLT